MPEISIITPVYQAEKFLKKCVDSILSQSFTDWELLLVDDGSTDRMRGSVITKKRTAASVRRGMRALRLQRGVISRLWTATIT